VAHWQLRGPCRSSGLTLPLDDTNRSRQTSNDSLRATVGPSTAFDSVHLSGLRGRKQDHDHDPEASRSLNLDLVNESALDPFAAMVSTDHSD
jgi:hypothetical protein